MKVVVPRLQKQPKFSVLPIRIAEVVRLCLELIETLDDRGDSVIKSSDTFGRQLHAPAALLTVSFRLIGEQGFVGQAAIIICPLYRYAESQL